MDGRYWITGVQLGMIKALAGSDTVQKIITQIEDTQFITSKTNFRKIMKIMIKKVLEEPKK